MNSQLSHRSSARPAVLAALFAAMLAALLVLGAPAQAHDTLLESDPADGATLETSPEAITLTYSADILDVSPLVRITDESGEQIAEITPSVDGPVVTAALDEPLPAGASTVQWRVVSSDGHPIEGTFTVTVEQEAAPEETAEAPSGEQSGEDSAPAETSDPGEGTATAAAEESAGDEGGSSMALILVVLGVVVVGAVVAVLVIMRRRD